MDAQLAAAIQKRGGDILATAVVPPNQASTDGEAEREISVAENQTLLKRSPVLSKIKVGKKGVSFPGVGCCVHLVPPVVGKQRQRGTKPDKMIEGWDPSIPVPNVHLKLRISADIV